MKLKGSMTIEAAVIVPLFTIIVLQMVLLAIGCHDRALINCVSDKICMDMEFNGYEDGKYSGDLLKELSNKGTLYLEEKTIRNGMVLEMESGLLAIKTEVSSINKNNPVEFVWITDAAKKLLEEE